MPPRSHSPSHTPLSDAHLLTPLQLRGGARCEELDQNGLVTAHTRACQVDHVSYVTAKHRGESERLSLARSLGLSFWSPASLSFPYLMRHIPTLRTVRQPNRQLPHLPCHPVTETPLLAHPTLPTINTYPPAHSPLHHHHTHAPPHHPPLPAGLHLPTVHHLHPPPPISIHLTPSTPNRFTLHQPSHTSSHSTLSTCHLPYFPPPTTALLASQDITPSCARVARSHSIVDQTTIRTTCVALYVVPKVAIVQLTVFLGSGRQLRLCSCAQHCNQPLVIGSKSIDGIVCAPCVKERDVVLQFASVRLKLGARLEHDICIIRMEIQEVMVAVLIMGYGRQSTASKQFSKAFGICGLGSQPQRVSLVPGYQTWRSQNKFSAAPCARINDFLHARPRTSTARQVGKNAVQM